MDEATKAAAEQGVSTVLGAIGVKVTPAELETYAAADAASQHDEREPHGAVRPTQMTSNGSDVAVCTTVRAVALFAVMYAL